MDEWDRQEPTSNPPLPRSPLKWLWAKISLWIWRLYIMWNPKSIEASVRAAGLTLLAHKPARKLKPFISIRKERKRLLEHSTPDEPNSQRLLLKLKPRRTGRIKQPVRLTLTILLAFGTIRHVQYASQMTKASPLSDWGRSLSPYFFPVLSYTSYNNLGIIFANDS